MKRLNTVLPFLTMLFVLVASSLSAGNRPPSVSASVRATAEVVHPLGIVNISEASAPESPATVMVRYPTPEGIQLTFQVDEEPVEMFAINQIQFDQEDDKFSYFNPSSVLMSLNYAIDPASQTVVITILSTTQ